MPSTLQALADLRPPRRRERYGPHPEQRAELHLPANAQGSVPVVVTIHGGFWQAARTRRYMRPLAFDLARNGWAAWNIEYRRLGRDGGWPATFDDVAAAIDHLANVDAPLDLDRVSVLGHSAGGQLALWAASRPTLGPGAPGAAPRVAVTTAAVGIAAASNLEATASFLVPGGAVHDLLGAGPDDAPDDRYALANPIHRLPLGIPTLLVHGNADTTVSVKRSREYAERARALGDDVTLIEPPGVGHRAVVDPRTSSWRHVIDYLGRVAV